jgi:hypothetical protein
VGEAAQEREFADRKPVQAQPQQVVGLVRVLDDLLQLVEYVAVEEAEQGPVDVQRVGTAEPGPGEQLEDVLERAQGAARAERQRGGQRPGDEQRDHIRVRQRQGAVVAGDGAQLGGPVGVGRVDLELSEHGLHDAVEQRRLVGRVPVEDHRVPAEGGPEAPHGQGVSPVAVDELKRGGQHQLTGDLAVTAARGVPGGWRWGHHGGTCLSAVRLILPRHSSVGLRC